MWLSRAVRWQYESGCGTGIPPVGCEPVNCTAYAAMEYRYQGGRARYMVRPRNPETMGLYPYTAADGQWFDYDGDEIYGDMALDYDEQTQTLTVTDVMAHEPGMAQYDQASEALHHLHGNLIGTTERMTDAAGLIAHRAVYTAFGELIYEGGVGVPPASTRYGYAGAWGYQAGAWDSSPGACDTGSGSQSCDPLAELGWLHVGERYYDPSSGRFVQRDPLGIEAGLNVYAYVGSAPTVAVDPSGLTSWWPNTGRIRYGPSRPIGSAVKRIGFRVGTKGRHLFGAGGAAAFAGSCVAAAAVGYGTGKALDWGVKKVTGKSLSDRIGEQIWGLVGTKGPPGYRPY